MWSTSIVVIVDVIHLLAMKLSYVLIEFLHLGMPRVSAHIVKLIKIICVIRDISIHVIVSMKLFMLITFVLVKALPGRLAPLREWIFF